MTTSSPSAPDDESSIAPAEFGDPKSETQTSSNARDSRGPRVNVWDGPEQEPMKQRYVALTVSVSAYDVLKARTSE